MKKVFLVLLIGFLILIPGVEAEVEDISCSTSINLLKSSNFIAGTYKPFDYTPDNIGYVSQSYLGLIKVEPSTTYHFQFESNVRLSSSSPTRVAVVSYDEDFNYISYYNWNNGSYLFSQTFTTKDTAYYITLHIYNANIEKVNSTNYQLEKGNSFTSYTEYVECPKPEEPDPVVPDSTLDTFYSIYLDKLGMLSSYAIENKFLFSSICIILLFIILEIILYLFKKGGYK